MDYKQLLTDFTRLCRESFQENLTGVYLHGSAAMGCFNPEKSDLDLIIVTEKAPGIPAKKRFMKGVAALNQLAPPKGLELSVVLRACCKPFVYPTPFELHFSPGHLERYLRDPEGYVQPAPLTDKDLAAHFTIINHFGRALWGPPVSDVFGPVPREDYIDSIWYDVENAAEDIVRDPVYVTLNLCRALAYLQDGLVLPKKAGGQWALENLPAGRRALPAKALEAYAGGGTFFPSPEDAREFARAMLEKIEGLR